MLVFALRATDVDLVADRLAEALTWPFAKHNSMYLGDYCLHRVPGLREVKVRWNRDPLHNPATDPPEERHRERGHPEYDVLIYASLPPSEVTGFQEALKAQFPEAVLIRSEKPG